MSICPCAEVKKVLVRYTHLLAQIYEVQCNKIRGHPRRGGGAAGLQPPPNPVKPKFKRY